jgi:hypothetical protein
MVQLSIMVGAKGESIASMSSPLGLPVTCNDTASLSLNKAACCSWISVGEHGSIGLAGHLQEWMQGHSISVITTSPQ